MLRNHFKFALRNLWRDKTYSLINILGLSVALASCFIILLYSVHELSYDRYNKKLDRVYMLTMNFGLSSLDWTQPLVPFPAGPTLKADAPEVERFARCSFRSCSVGYGRRTIHSVQCVSSDFSIFKILTLPVVSGNLEEASAGPNYVVISRRLAEKIFGVGEVVGHVIDVNWAGEEYHLTVGAVIANIPSTSTFRADCILPMFLAEQSIKKMFPDNPDVLNAWMPGVINTYLLLSNNKSAEQLRKKLIGFSKEHSTIPSWPLKLHLVPLKDVYFRPATVVNTYPIPRGNLSDVEIYSLVAILTLLTACVNFVVLSTGRASVRTKEIGVRKVIGASRFDIAGQVMVESATVFVLSLPIALVLVEIFMPSLTTLLGKRLPSTDSRTLESVIVYLIVTFLAGVFSGSYLSFYLSGLHPAEILRKRFDGGRSGASLRRVLLSFQMIIFVGLILASITIYRQTRYFHTKDMGFNDKNLVVFSDLRTSYADTSFGSRFRTFESDLDVVPNVASVACGSWMPATGGETMEQAPDPSNPQRPIMFEVYWVSRDFFETLEMKMVYGKTFAQVSPGESKNALIMNQEAAKEFGITNPSRQLFQGHRILGIVSNANFHSLRRKIVPAVFYDGPEQMNEIVVRLRQMKDAPQTIGSIEKEIEKFDGGRKVKYEFFDDRINQMYGSDYKFAGMIGYFTGLAIFIASLGLFGMSLFVIQRRVKEIGVRKVLGASVQSIFLTSAKEFLMTLLVSAVISGPITIYFIDEWLGEYAYHINVNAGSVLITIVVGLVTVLIAVGYQSLKAATENPVESLRYE